MQLLGGVDLPCQANLLRHLAARRPRIVGVSLLPGSLTSERVKFWLSPTMMPSRKSSLHGCSVGAGRSGKLECLDALILAVAAIGVCVEIAYECALDG